MSTSTPIVPPSASKRQSGAEVSRTRKRTRNSPSAQDQDNNEPMSLRGGQGSFSPAAGTWQRSTAQSSNQNRLFSNLGRVPVDAGLGIAAPTRPTIRSPATVSPIRQTPAQQARPWTGTMTGPGGPTPEDSSAERSTRNVNTLRDNQGSTLRSLTHLSIPFCILPEHSPIHKIVARGTTACET